MAVMIPTSINQTVGAARSLASSAASIGSGLAGDARSSATQAATDLTAAGSNLLKLNQQAASAVQGLLPNGTLAINPSLSQLKTGLDGVFSAEGATATATQFFKAAKETATKIANDVKAVAEKISSGVNLSSPSASLSSGIGSLTKVVSSAASAVGSAARTASSYVPGAALLQQTGAIDPQASARLTSAVSSLKTAGAIAGVNTAQLTAAAPVVAQATSALSQAAKISAPGVLPPGGLGLPAIPSIPAIPGLPAGIPKIDPAQLKAATAAIEAAQNPPNPLADTGAKIGAVDRSQIDSAFMRLLPPGLPSFDPGTISAAQQAGASINNARFKNVMDKDLTYGGEDPQVWDDINAERLKRGLTGLPNPRPPEDSAYTRRYSQPAGG